MDENQELKREFRVMTTMTIVIGSAIGAGVFFKPYVIYQATMMLLDLLFMLALLFL